MRLVDADAILKADENSDKALVLGSGKSLEIAYALLKKKVADAPTVDAVPVVRCKDCTKFEQKGKYYNGRPFGYCYHWDYEEGSSPNEVDGDDFCSYGERRDKP